MDEERSDDLILLEMGTKAARDRTSVQDCASSVTTAIILIPHPNPFHDSLRQSQFIYHTDVLYYTMKGAIGVVGEEEGRSVKAWRRLITWGGKEVGKDWKVWVQGQDSKQDDDDDKDGSDSDSSSSPSPLPNSSPSQHRYPTCS